MPMPLQDLPVECTAWHWGAFYSCLDMLWIYSGWSGQPKACLVDVESSLPNAPSGSPTRVVYSTDARLFSLNTASRLSPRILICEFRASWGNSCYSLHCLH